MGAGSEATESTAVGRSQVLGGTTLLFNVDLVVAVWSCFTCNACEARQAYLGGSDDPDLSTAGTSLSAALGLNGVVDLTAKLGSVRAGIMAHVKIDVGIDRDGYESSFDNHIETVP